MRTYIKAYTSLNFGQIPPLTTELAALERLKNQCHHVISVDIDPIFFKLAGNKNMHNIMNEFEFRRDQTTDYRVSCPWASKKYPYRLYNGENGVSTFSLLFLIGSFWYFHVTRTCIKSWMTLNFLKWDLTLAHWTQVSDCCPLGYLFCCVNLVFFQYAMLSKCIDSRYLVGATPLTVFHQLFWNIADVFSMEWRCACGFGIILWLFFSLFLLCELNSLLLWNAIKVYKQWVPWGPNSSYSFPSIVLKLCRCFRHGMKMCMWFGYNTLFFLTFSALWT